MEKVSSLIIHGESFILGVITFITDHPATFLVGLVGAATVSLATQYAKYAIKFYTSIQKSHWFLLLTGLLTTVGSIITYVATNVSAEDVKFSSWLTAMFTAVTFAYPVVKAITNFLAAYQLVKKPLEDKVKEVVELAQQEEETTSVIATSDKGKESVVTTIQPPVEDEQKANIASF